MTYYAIRHKASGNLMPLMRRNRGYSHWNPATGKVPTYALPVPRMLQSAASAKKCIAQWVALPNGRQSSYQSYAGEWDDIVDSKPDGRTRDDLEVVRLVVRVHPHDAIRRPSEHDPRAVAILGGDPSL